MKLINERKYNLAKTKIESKYKTHNLMTEVLEENDLLGLWH